MKKITIAAFIAFLMLTGCNQNEMVVTPDQNLTDIPETNQNSWLEYTSPLINNGLTKEKTKEIRWRDGGRIVVKINKIARDGRIVIAESQIQFPPKSWDREKYGRVISFVMDLATKTASVSFEPHMSFRIPPIVNARFEGIKLDNYDLSNPVFAYQAANGSVEIIPNDKIIVNSGENLLEVIGAEIPHFSRYGFLR